MNRSKLLLVPALVASATLVAAPAQATATHVTPTIGHVYTHSDDVKHNVDPGGTYTDCGNPVDEIYLKARVTHAHKGKSFKEIWLKDGVKQLTETFTWGKNGAFNDFFGLVANDGTFEDGTWKVKIVESGNVLGQSQVTLQTDC
jgi:hypothetical protein